MFPIAHFIKGFFKNLFNPKISSLAFVSANNKLESDVVIYRGAKVKHSSIGKYTYIGANTDVECADIGRFCSISDHCRIGMASHSLNMLSTCPIFTLSTNGTQTRWVDKNVIDENEDRLFIGNDVWIGSHVLIKGGITIGDGAVIGAGAVVVKDVPPYAIVGGVPAKVIRYRFPVETIELLENIKWWDFEDNVLKSRIQLFQTETIDEQLLNELKTNEKC